MVWSEKNYAVCFPEDHFDILSSVTSCVWQRYVGGGVVLMFFGEN